jgi:hypothetical protein
MAMMAAMMAMMMAAMMAMMAANGDDGGDDGDDDGGEWRCRGEANANTDRVITRILVRVCFAPTASRTWLVRVCFAPTASRTWRHRAHGGMAARGGIVRVGRIAGNEPDGGVVFRWGREDPAPTR